MCFRNLPIEFDSRGQAFLSSQAPDPFAYETREISRDQIKELVARNGYVKSVDFDPVTRVAGALAFHATVDLKARKVLEAASMATLFRGYEVILKGRDPRDAIFISSRACGVCGGVHATCSALTIEMAFGICPPPLGVEVRNLGAVAEMFYDRPLHLGLLAGPDYSTALVSVTNPEIVTRAEKTLAPNADIHGYTTIKDIMDAMN